MSDADTARHIFVVAILGQVVHLPLGFIYIEVTVIADHCHTGTVVAPVFQTFQSLNQDGIRFLCSDISYNSTHIIFSYILFSLYFTKARFTNRLPPGVG